MKKFPKTMNSIMKPKQVTKEINSLVEDLMTITPSENPTTLNQVNVNHLTVNPPPLEGELIVASGSRQRSKIDVKPVEVKNKLEEIFHTVEDTIEIAVDNYDGNPMGAKGLADLLKAVQGLLQAIDDIDDPADKYRSIVEDVLIITQKNFMKALSEKVYKAFGEINISLPETSEKLKPILNQIILDTAKQVSIDFDNSLPKLQDILGVKFEE